MFFSPFVIGPAHLSRCNVVVLPFPGPTTDENHEALAVLAKINAVAGAEINLVLAKRFLPASSVAPKLERPKRW
jgi:hypothetical protein